MNAVLTVGFGLLARFLAVLAEHLAEWLLRRVNEGVEGRQEWLDELWEFGRWFLRSFAGGLCSRSRNLFYENERW